MSAKIVKNSEAVSGSASQRVLPFSLRQLGNAGVQTSGVAEYLYPQLDGMSLGNGDPTIVKHHSVLALDLERPLGDALPMIAPLESEREKIEKAAYEKATAEAMATFDAKVAERAATEVESMREQLGSSLAAIDDVLHELIRQAESDTVDLALALAKKIIHQEATTDREIVVNIARTALARLHSRSMVEVRLHPDDHGYLLLHQDKLGYRGSVELVADGSVSPGGCIVHTEAGDVDATIESQLDAIADALRAPFESVGGLPNEVAVEILEAEVA